MNALVIVGSLTAEDRFGVRSGNRVAVALQTAGWSVEILHAARGDELLRCLVESRPHVVVPVGFGPPCEDGHVYAAARLAGIPCAGPSPASGAVMQDKSILSRVVDSVFDERDGVRSPRGCVLSSRLTDDVCKSIVRHLRPPLVVKPAFSGSSDGLSVVDTHEGALALAIGMLESEGKALIQQLEYPAVEISCTVLDDAAGRHLLPIVQLRRDDVVVLGPEEKFGSSALDRHIVPALLSQSVTKRVHNAVEVLHEAVGAVGLTRTDILLVPGRRRTELVVLEMNGIPGLLESSIACDAARAAGISFDQLAVKYAESAFLERPEPRVWGRRD